jgi:hypothetical protein
MEAPLTVRRLSLGMLGMLLVLPPCSWSQPAQDRSIGELRHAVGAWDVVTEFLNADGSVARAVRGTYAFEWVVADRVVRGLSEIPELKQRSAITFYVNAAAGTIEMTSVGADGQLFVMTGPLGGDTRETSFTPPDGKLTRLRFTRFNVTPDRFESRMERSTDGGATWLPGNHQVFVRRAG